MQIVLITIRDGALQMFQYRWNQADISMSINGLHYPAG